MRVTEAGTLIPSREAGFTLIELSIVLVIIGLIAGGILVGHDMIKAAELRATISQVQKYDSAVNTFHNKYGYLPGDMPSTQAGNFGLFAVTSISANLQGYGDGNGLIEDCSNTTWSSQCGEPAIFWRQLTDASLVDGNFGTTTSGTPLQSSMHGGAGMLLAAIAGATMGEVFPPAKLGNGNYFAVYSGSGVNWFEITGLTSMGPGGAVTTANRLTPLQADTIDLKIDDGLPLTGSVTAGNSGTLGVLSTTGAGLCVTTADLYDTITSGPSNTLLCQSQIRFN